MIDHLANRIERAYALRRAGWDRGCSTGRVWAAAALCLWQAHVEDPALPLDSELFVASQPITGSFGDPWVELTQAEAGRRYRIQVRRIVHRLRRELRREVRRAERFMTDGGRLIISSLSQDGRLSPLGCYIAAQRMDRADLAEHFAIAAVEQHRGCPLYRVASQSLLPPDRYPLGPAAGAPESGLAVRSFKKSIVMN
jgi:hypothetical protein